MPLGDIHGSLAAPDRCCVESPHTRAHTGTVFAVSALPQVRRRGAHWSDV